MRSILIGCLFIMLMADLCQSRIIVVGSLTHETNLSPGEQFEGSIMLENTDPEYQDVKVYQTDYMFTSDGNCEFGEPGSCPRSNSSWISISDHLVTVPPNSHLVINYRGSVPNDPTLSGTYWSVIMIEPLGSSSRDMLVSNGTTIAVTTVARYAIQVITNIGEDSDPILRFIGKNFKRTEEGMFLEVDVQNEGTSYARPSAWVEIYDEDARSIGRFESPGIRIFPGCSVRHSFRITNLARGTYQALVILDDASDQIYGAQYTLVIE
ncbi:MAG: hypothetical protein ACUVQ7_01270 [bacterium]